MRSARYLFILIPSLFFSGELLAQIGAEAQGGKMSLWTALGIDQDLSEKWMSVTDFGFGRHSDPDNYDLLKRQGLNVITQDVIFKPSSHWSFYFSFGYWRRNFYSDDFPYDPSSAPRSFRNELRPYQRVAYRHSIGRFELSHTFRTDYRFYFDQYLKNAWSTPFEFRLRFLENVKFALSRNREHSLIAVDEVLTAADHYSNTSPAGKDRWSAYQFTENRLSFYYRRSLIRQKIDLDFGIMHQYWRDKPGVSSFNISYNLMFDIIIRDPFSKKKDES